CDADRVLTTRAGEGPREGLRAADVSGVAGRIRDRDAARRAVGVVRLQLRHGRVDTIGAVLAIGSGRTRIALRTLLVPRERNLEPGDALLPLGGVDHADETADLAVAGTAHTAVPRKRATGACAH